MARRTEESYVDWIRRFIVWSGKRHPKEMGAEEVRGFLTHLAADGVRHYCCPAFLFLSLRRPLVFHQAEMEAAALEATLARRFMRTAHTTS
jgi:hypothetical protein